tara:strand:+ start:366 stop:1508 length:1143 start_codon:yes stop_codon:yes gene_type:complete
MLKIYTDKKRKLYIVDFRKIGGKKKAFSDKRLAEISAQQAWKQYINAEYVIHDNRVYGKDAIQEWKEEIISRFNDDRFGESEKNNKLRSAKILNNQMICGKRFKDWDLGEFISGRRVPLIISREIINGDITINHVNGNPSTINTRQHYLCHFNEFFRYCVSAGYLNKNPLANTTLKERKNKKDEKAERISSKNMLKILQNMDKKFQIVMEFAIQTGIRQGEQRALMWKHIDFDKRTVRIEQAIQSNIVGNVKSQTSYRTISLTDEMCKKLQMIKLKRGVPGYNDFVFTIKNKRPIAAKSFIKYLHNAIDKSNLKRFRWHDLRHYFASILFNKFGQDYNIVTDLLGHASIEFTKSKYVHWFENVEEQERVREAISENIVIL